MHDHRFKSEGKENMEKSQINNKIIIKSNNNNKSLTQTENTTRRNR